MARTAHTALDGTFTITDTRTLAEAQDEAVGRIETEYAAQIAAGTTYSGRPLQIDPESTANMTAMAASVNAGIPLQAGFAWRMGDNTFLPVTGEQVVGMGAVAMARVYSLLVAYWAAKDAARAAKTREEADAVKAAWPE